jgi:hypothetical protein
VGVVLELATLVALQEQIVCLAVLLQQAAVLDKVVKVVLIIHPTAAVVAVKVEQ